MTETNVVMLTQVQEVFYGLCVKQSAWCSPDCTIMLRVEEHRATGDPLDEWYRIIFSHENPRLPRDEMQILVTDLVGHFDHVMGEACHMVGREFRKLHTVETAHLILTLEEWEVPPD